MSNGDDKVLGALEIAADTVWEREAARRALLAHLGLIPMISRCDAVGAMPANRFAAPHLETGGGALAVGGALGAEINGTAAVDGPVLAATSQTLTAERQHRAAAESGSLIKAESKMEGEQLRALLRDDSGAKSSRVSDEINPKDNSPFDVIQKKADERLSLLIVVTRDVLWIEQLDDYLLRKEQLHLVAAMARAIRGPTVNCEHQQFDWPPAGGFKPSQKDGLADMLSGFLQRLIADHQSQMIIQLGSVEVLPSLPLAWHRIPSSLTMLQEPSTKREAWEVLKSLVASS